MIFLLWETFWEFVIAIFYVLRLVIRFIMAIFPLPEWTRRARMRQA